MSRLVIERVSFNYGRAPVLHEVSLDVRAGEVVAVVGPSGAGKTTLLWLMAGLHRPSTGRVFVEGDTPIPARIAVALQPPGLWDHLSVRQHLDLLLHQSPYTRQERQRRAEVTLDRLALLRLHRARPPALSSGERQRLSIARALVLQWPWLLLDEPLTHLDFPRRRDLLSILREQAEQHGVGVLMVTHHGAEVLPAVDRVAVLVEGRLRQFGDSATVYAQPDSLETALLLGDAIELDSSLLAAGGASGALYRRETRLVARPDLLVFQPVAAAPWTVVRASPGWVEATAGDFRVRARSFEPASLPIGTTGRMTLLVPGSQTPL